MQEEHQRRAHKEERKKQEGERDERKEARFQVAAPFKADGMAVR